MSVSKDELSFRSAIKEAIDEELAADENVIFFGEDVAEAGGVFTDWRGREDVRGGSAVAAGAAVHAEMLTLLRLV